MKYDLFYNECGWGFVLYCSGRRYREVCYFDTRIDALLEAEREVNKYYSE
jgi:hypothetical protein